MKVVLVTLALMMLAASSRAVEIPELEKKSGCTTCHAIDRAVIGPSWQEVALKYRGKATYEYAGKIYPLEDGLLRKLSWGGRRHWGDAIMIPNDPDLVQQDDFRQLVRFILKLVGKPPATMLEFKEQGVEPGNGESFKDCWNCPEMVMVPPGQFMMGIPGSQKQQIISQAFAVGKYEVTFAEWDACAADGGCARYRPDDQGWGRGRQPVVNVNWNDTQKYVRWLSQRTGKSYRLLTETEWEYAARAGATTTYPWGDVIGSGNANCNGCGSQWDDKQPAPVGSFKANAFGIYDMNGNVCEWTENCVDVNCNVRVVRGGSWFYDALSVGSVHRSGDVTKARDFDDGFRVARDLP